MSSEGSVTRWLSPLQAGDPAAAQQLWERFFRRLVGLARQQLQGIPRGAADEEDVALSALDSFIRNAGRGRFPDLADRDGLWRLLVTIAVRKAAHLRRDQGRQKRPGGAAAPADQGAGEEPALEEVLSREPSPDLEAQAAEQYLWLLEVLGDEELKQVAVWRMEGYSVEEVAAKLGCAPRSVKRRLQLIRKIWEKEAGPE
jgi:DNA-directed RNA polymerase specialized sigma24 family protein